MNTLCLNLTHIKNNVSFNLAEFVYTLYNFSVYCTVLLGRVQATEIYELYEEVWLISSIAMLLQRCD